jgi:hypothetical protein
LFEKLANRTKPSMLMKNKNRSHKTSISNTSGAHIN